MEATFGGGFSGRFGRPFRHLEEIDSTNEEALRWAASETLPEGALVVADSQTAGRGRWGREWLSRPGSSLLMSLVLKPTWTGERLGMLTLACGLATARALEGAEVDGVGIKWPNDVLIDGKKVAGILVESRLRSGHDHLAVVGIGVNIAGAGDLPPEVAERATDLASATGGRLGPGERAALLEGLLAELEEVYETLGRADGVETVRSAVRERMSMLGAEVVVRTATGEVLEGIAEDLGVDGGLVLKSGSGRQLIHAAEIETVRAR